MEGEKTVSIMTEKGEEEVWVVKGGFLEGEKAWTMSKVKFRKKWGKRLLIVSLLSWVGVIIGVIFKSPWSLLGFIVFFITLIGWGLHSEAKNAEQIGKERIKSDSSTNC